jgi:hypothetical protein
MKGRHPMGSVMTAILWTAAIIWMAWEKKERRVFLHRPDEILRYVQNDGDSYESLGEKEWWGG